MYLYKYTKNFAYNTRPPGRKMLQTSRSRYFLQLLMNSAFLGTGTGQDKFSFDFDRIESCAAFENVDVDLSSVSVDMSEAGEIELRGSFAFNIDIDKGPWGIAAELYRDTGQQYISIFSDKLDDFCQELGRAGAPWSELLRTLHPKPPSECPVKASTYDVTGLRADTDALEYKKELEGGYKLNVKMSQPSAPGAPPAVFLCYDIFFILGVKDAK